MRTTPKQVGAIVLGGAHGSLAVLRSLGRKGIPVWFLTHDHIIPKFSRFCSRHFHWDGPFSETAADDLVSFGEQNDLHGWVLFAGADAEVMFISLNYSKLCSVFRLTTPPWETTRFAIDKRLTHEWATKAAVCYPRTFYPRNAGELNQIDCQFPVILKPTIRLGDDRFSRSKAWLVANPTQLTSRYVEAATLVESSVISVQEFIPGHGANQYSYAALWQQGRPVVSLTARRKRQYPIDCGTSTCVELLDEPSVEAASNCLLQNLSYNGLVEIEFKYDSREDQYKVLDVNARPWAWIGLGSAAGIDFPLIAWQSAIGEQSVTLPKRSNATWHYFSRDVLAICGEMARCRFSLKMASKRSVFAAFARDDPLPGLVDLPLTLWRMIRRLALKADPQPKFDLNARPRSPIGQSLAAGRST